MLDSWQDEGFHFFVFVLHAEEGAQTRSDDPPVVVFAMHPEAEEPVSAVVVTPDPEGGEAQIKDLREPESVYTAPLA